MNESEISNKIIQHLSEKHDRKVTEDDYLDDIGEDCDFSLTFELAELFDVDGWCDGDEIGKNATVGNAIEAISTIKYNHG